MISRGMQVYLEYKNAHRCKNNIFLVKLWERIKKKKLCEHVYEHIYSRNLSEKSNVPGFFFFFLVILLSIMYT